MKTMCQRESDRHTHDGERCEVKMGKCAESSASVETTVKPQGLRSKVAQVRTGFVASDPTWDVIAFSHIIRCLIVLLHLADTFTAPCNCDLFQSFS